MLLVDFLSARGFLLEYFSAASIFHAASSFPAASGFPARGYFLCLTLEVGN